jgi:hypothetical protein
MPKRVFFGQETRHLKSSYKITTSVVVSCVLYQEQHVKLTISMRLIFPSTLEFVPSNPISEPLFHFPKIDSKSLEIIYCRLRVIDESLGDDW